MDCGANVDSVSALWDVEEIVSSIPRTSGKTTVGKLRKSQRG